MQYDVFRTHWQPTLRIWGQKMSKDLVEDEDIWAQLSETYNAALGAERAFRGEGVNRTALLRKGLRTGDVAVAFYAADMLTLDEKMELFDVWVEWAMYSQGYTDAAQEIIRSLPRDWVLERIEAVAYPLLDDADSLDYSLLLALFRDLDRDLAERLASKALESPDAETRFVGQQFLDQLEQS
jgi:hypothetical protein